MMIRLELPTCRVNELYPTIDPWALLAALRRGHVEMRQNCVSSVSRLTGCRTIGDLPGIQLWSRDGRGDFFDPRSIFRPLEGNQDSET